MRASVVVTGGSRGIGRGIVKRLTQDRLGVVILDLAAPTDDLSKGAIDFVRGDAGDEAAAEESVERARVLGRMRGWVNNAAIFEDRWLHDGPALSMLEAINSNLAKCIVGSRVAVRTFLSDGTAGSIVNISSHQARRPVRGCMAYATAKSAIEAVTRSLAVDYGSRGIRANALSLGTIQTERYLDLIAEDAVGAESIPDQMARLHALGRVGTIDEVAAAVAFLLSDASAFISGATIPVDGGRSMLGADPEAQG